MSKIKIIELDKDDMSQLSKDLSTDSSVSRGLKELVDTGVAVVLAAQIDGSYIGSVVLANKAVHESAFRREYPDIPVVYSLYVSPNHQRQGIGSRLMTAVENYAFQRGHSKLILGVTEGNKAARDMYEKRGYKYLKLNGDGTVKSEWITSKSDGKDEITVVEVMPMLLDMQDSTFKAG